MKRTGFYIVKDEFFADMQESYLKGNKEENRPHYYCFGVPFVLLSWTMVWKMRF